MLQWKLSLSKYKKNYILTLKCFQQYKFLSTIVYLPHHTIQSQISCWLIDYRLFNKTKRYLILNMRLLKLNEATDIIILGSKTFFLRIKTYFSNELVIRWILSINKQILATSSIKKLWVVGESESNNCFSNIEKFLFLKDCHKWSFMISSYIPSLFALQIKRKKVC